MIAVSHSKAENNASYSFPGLLSTGEARAANRSSAPWWTAHSRRAAHTRDRVPLPPPPAPTYSRMGWSDVMTVPFRCRLHFIGWPGKPENKTNGKKKKLIVRSQQPASRAAPLQPSQTRREPRSETPEQLAGGITTLLLPQKQMMVTQRK